MLKTIAKVAGAPGVARLVDLASRALPQSEAKAVNCFATCAYGAACGCGKMLLCSDGSGGCTTQYGWCCYW